MSHNHIHAHAARDYRKYNVRLTSADWQRGSDRVIRPQIAHISRREKSGGLA